MADDKIVIEFKGDNEDINKALKEINVALNKTQGKAKDTRKILSTIGGGIKKVFQVGALAVTAFGGAVIGAVNEARKFETITTQFQVLTGSVEQAKLTVQELQQFAASTPFQFEGISRAAQQLLGFGFSADELVPKLKEIGNVSAAIGKPVDEISLIFGQVAAAGKLTGERLLQFQERAIPIGPAIAKTLGVAETSVKDLVSKGVVDFEVFEKAFRSLSEEGGFAFGGIEKQSKTLSGVISTIRDNFSLFAARLGERVLPAVKLLGNQLLDFLQNLNKTGDGVEFFGSTLNTLFNIAIRIKAGFQQLGTVIGGSLATAIETATAAINLNFAQASEIAKQGARQLAADLASIERETQEQISSIDKSFQESKKADREKDLEDIKAKKNEEKEIKAQALYDEAAVLREIEAEIAELKFADEEAKQEKINDIVNKKLKEQFNAKRANSKQDIKESLKENKLRLQEEQRFGKSLSAISSTLRSDQVTAAKAAFSALESLSASNSKTLGRIAKVGGIGRAIINTAEGATAALKLGFPLGPIAAGTIVAAGAAQIATISSQAFAKGGLVQGGILGKDSVPAVLQQGEFVVPRNKAEDVINAAARQQNINQGNASGSNQVEVALSFTDNIGEFIEAQILERRALGTGAI